MYLDTLCRKLQRLELEASEMDHKQQQKRDLKQRIEALKQVIHFLESRRLVPSQNLQDVHSILNHFLKSSLL